MALSIGQIRNDNPAVLPIDPASLILVDEQIDQSVGSRSTAATAAEIIATGGTVVETAVSYEALYADEKVIATASNITLSIASNMRVGARKTFWRTAAYDGNPVTITPPSGATFEGLASIDLYGKYSYVELERISATVFVIKDLKDKFAYVPTAGFNNLPGYWSTTDNWIIRDKETVFVSLQYVSSGAATSIITISKDSLTPYGSRVKITGANCNLLKAAQYRISAIYDGGGFYSQGVACGTTTPFTWAAGDAISFYTTFRLE